MSKQESNAEQRSNASYAGNSANGQEAELREQINQLWDTPTREGHVKTCGEYQHTVDETLQLINSHTTKLLNEQLGRLQAQWGETIDHTMGRPIRIKFIPLSAIENERRKLK